METAKRYNQGKLRLDLIPNELLEAVAKVQAFGANKYGEDNWRKGMKWMDCISSLKRHILAFESLEDNDEESGLSHLGHAAANISYLLTYLKTHPELDNRIRPEPKKIGLDIDGVLADFNGAYTSFTSTQTGANITYEELDKIESFWMNIEPLLWPKDIPFIPTAYITSRRIPTEWTEAWLEKHKFPKAPVYSKITLKSYLINSLDLDIFVDDLYENYLEITKSGKLCYLFTQPWNEHYKTDRRIKTLNQLV